MQVYLDASAVLPFFVDDRHTVVMQEWAHGGTFRVLLSDFAAAEVSAAVSRGLRTGRLQMAGAETALADFDRWRLQTYQRLTGADDIAECERLVRDFDLKLNAPDALHLAIAKAEAVPLVTFDQRLAGAARALGHAVVVPGQ